MKTINMVYIAVVCMHATNGYTSYVLSYKHTIFFDGVGVDDIICGVIVVGACRCVGSDDVDVADVVTMCNHGSGNFDDIVCVGCYYRCGCGVHYLLMLSLLPMLLLFYVVCVVVGCVYVDGDVVVFVVVDVCVVCRCFC